MDNDILANAPFWAAFIGFFGAQFLKPFITFAVEHTWTPNVAFSTGGMPSSHTAGVIALIVAVGMSVGCGTVDFAICCCFGAITIHDAMGIRRAAGKQAEVINEWSSILSDIHKDGRFTQEHLKTMLGHSFSQVFGGAVFGAVVGFAVTYFFK
jgi:acid phosphatase family membrane protein YuiD